ncbi:bone morphogenetic protein 1 homolog isoform X1 [Hydra vulgaris]|uniref:bone morphogenetic protein 1 homolog isoform X1 n=2 Tax=Hydra vulgaris TaxID=6087 RepID=UPI001F5F6ACA|nr:bone morphogenetic protein 1 homolog isoform X1 [Hydra vulgaris]
MNTGQILKYDKTKEYINIFTVVMIFAFVAYGDSTKNFAEDHFEIGQSCGAEGYYLDAPIPEAKTTKRKSRMKRAATMKSWPEGRIPFVIDSGFSSVVNGLIREAMNHWENETCVKFLNRTNEYDYVYIYKGNGCCSYVGRRGGKQFLSLGTGCIRFGIITHELGHVIGFWHEQNRPDRSIYIDVIYENMDSSKSFNFDPRNLNEVKTFDQVYDFHSIMHYGNNFFTKNGGKTILSKAPENAETNEIGMSYFKYKGPVLSPQDILETNLLYRCTKLTECGGTIFATSGSFASYPNRYQQEMNKDCVWIITTAIKFNSRSSLTVIFNDFSVGKPSHDQTGNCEDDYLEVREGKGFLSPFIVRYCGQRKPAPITTLAGSLYIRLHISGKNLKSYSENIGFNVSFKTDTCSQLIKQVPAIIHSPQFPFGYQLNTDCVWNVEAQPGMQTKIEFGFFSLRELDNEEGCLDYVEIHKDLGTAESFVGRFCGSNNPGKLVINSERVKIHFHASNVDHQGWFMGFEAEIDQYDIDECQLGLHECTQACINYPGGYFCGCNQGYDTIYHRSSRKAQCVDKDECSINNGGCSHKCINTDGSFVCGCPKGFTISFNKSQCQDINECVNKPCNQICKNNIGSYECSCYEGYILQSNNKTCSSLSGCLGSFTSSVGRITSPQVPSTYKLPIVCVWQVQGAPHLQLKFDIVLVSKENNDCGSYVTFFKNEMERRQKTYLKKICIQSDITDAFVMSTSSAIIEYVGQFPFQTSFMVEYHSVVQNERECLYTYNASSGEILSPGFPYQYSDEQDCLWNIHSLHQTTFKVIFLQFSLESHETCEFDYLEVEQIYYEMQRVKKIGRFCGERIPDTLFINGHASFVRIRFHSDSTNTGKGFKMVFNETDHVS